MTDKRKSKTVLTWISVAAIAVFTFFVFSPSLDDGFTNWDDITYVTDNPLVINNSVQLVKIIETPVSGNYHPLTVLSLALNYQIDKLNPFGYHLENLIFHVFNTILVFLFIFWLTRRNLLMAAIVSLFFGIHPMHVESVTWISERKDVLYVFFFLLGLISYLRYFETKKVIWYIFTFLLFILSCLSKGMAVIFPVILLLIDYLKGVKWEKWVLIEKIPFFLLSPVFGIVAIRAQQSARAVSVMNFLPLFQRLMFGSYSAILYIIKLFVPFKLSAFYPYPDVNSSNGIPLVFYLSPFILLGTIAALIYFFRKKQKEIIFGLLFYFVSIVFVLKFISVGSSIMADRYSYLPYIGLLFVVAYLINTSWQNKTGILASLRYLFFIIAIIGAIAFSNQTYSHSRVWKNSETLWTNVIDNYPNTSIAYINRAKYYHINHELGKAKTDYNEALKFNLSDIGSSRDAYYNLGLLYANYGKNDSAVSDFTKALELDSTFADAYNNRAWFYFINGKKDSAIADYNKAIKFNDTSALYHYNRGLLYYKTANQYKKALDDFAEAIQLDPSNAELYYNISGACNVRLNNYYEAIADFSKVIEINPSVAGYWFNRSIAESKLGQNENAKSDSLKAKLLQGN